MTTVYALKTSVYSIISDLVTSLGRTSNVTI